MREEERQTGRREILRQTERKSGSGRGKESDKGRETERKIKSGGE